MTSWAIVGATRGIGFEYVKQLSSNQQNTVLALIRNQNTAGPLNDFAASNNNVHVVETDISSVSRLHETAEKIGSITGGKLDVLILNAFSPGTDAALLPPSAFIGKEDALEKEIFEPLKVNLLHQMFVVNAFLPLIRKGHLKKVIYISSGMGDINVIRVCELPSLLGYAVGKASGNIMMAKYAAELKSEGIKTLSLSPGWVETDTAKELVTSPEAFQFMLSSFQKLDPNVKGMTSTEDSVRDQLSVIDGLDEHKSGLFLSQHGNQDWF